MTTVSEREQLFEVASVHTSCLVHLIPDAARYTEINNGKYLDHTYTEENFFRVLKLTAAMLTILRDDLVAIIAKTKAFKNCGNDEDEIVEHSLWAFKRDSNNFFKNSKQQLLTPISGPSIFG
jgi:hypothetical protein